MKLKKVSIVLALAFLANPLIAKEINYETDVVVVGAGLAGLSTAMSVIDNGGKVILIEKLPGLGGAGNYYAGSFGGDSDYKRRNGFKHPTPDEAFDIAMECYHFRVNAASVRKLVDASGPAMDWVEKHGWTWQKNVRGVPTFHTPPNYHGAGLIKIFSRWVQDHGGTILLETPGKELIVENGKVVGVKAKNYLGDDVIIKAKAVALTTGGFPNNPEMLKKYVPDYGAPGAAKMLLRGPGIDGRVGDGINMAKDIGAQLMGMNTIVGNSPYVDYEPAIFQINGPRWLQEVRAAVSQPFLWVNKYGERFFNEGRSRKWNDVHNAMTVNGGVLYSIFDENMKKKMEEEGPLINFNQIVIKGEKMTSLERGLQEGIKGGYCFKADTIEDLAKQINVPVEALKQSVANVNEYVKNGKDPVFGRPKEFLFTFSDHGPYYAVRGLRAYFQTVGGVKMNTNMQALDKDNQVIPGLYMGGNDMGGLYDTSYDMLVPGFTSSFAITSGYLIGKHLKETNVIGNK